MPINTENRFLLIYGSQTGQAQAISEEIADKAETFGLHADIHCLSKTEKKFNIENERCVVFVISTTGEGDAPDTSKKFMRRLCKRTLTSDYLSHLRFTILGLGDTNYTNFCNCGQSLHKRLVELGGKTFYAPDWADDGVGLEVVVEPWIDNLFDALKVQLKESSSIIVKDSTVCTDSKSDSKTSSVNLENIITNTSDNKTTELPVPLQTASNLVQNMAESINNTTDSVTLIENSTNIVDSEGTKSKLKPETVEEETSPAVSEPSLTASLPPLSTSDLTLPALPPSYIQVDFREDEVGNLEALPRQNGWPFPSIASAVNMVQVMSATVLTADSAVKKTLKISLDIQNCELNYKPGDSVSIICPNKEAEVTELFTRLDVIEKADCVVKLTILPNTTKRRAVIPAYIPETATLRHIFLTCIEIREPPKKALLRVFVEHTSNPRQKRRLQELCSKQGGTDYSQYIRETSLSILDILTAFPSCHPPIHSLIEHTTRLKPRPYSACSAPCTNPSRLDVVFNILDIPGENGRHNDRRGICTGWLDDITRSIQKKTEDVVDEMSVMSLNEDIKIPIFKRTNQHFRPPEDLACPVIFIGPGTGVAPFIGFLSEREHKRQAAGDGMTYGETWLFYGCRNKDKDYLFRKELEGFQSTNTLQQLCVCFSRDEQPDNAPRYVQDFITQEADALFKLLENEKSIIYVCGDANNMAKNVNEAFMNILKSKKDLSADEANSYLMKMRIHKRYFEDVWT